MSSGFHERPLPILLQHPERPATPAEPIDLFRFVPRDLEQALELWLPTLRRILAYGLHSDEVDDVLHEVVEELIQAWDAVVAVDSPLAMALVIARRRRTKFVKKGRQHSRSLGAKEDPAAWTPPSCDRYQSDPERQLAVQQRAAVVHRILSGLPARQREAFLYLRVHQLTGEEAATALKTTVKAVYSREKYARMKIEAELKRLRAREERGTRC